MEHLMTAYGRLPVLMQRGSGAKLFDDQGREYLDALSGIAVCSLGHANKALADAFVAEVLRPEPGTRVAGFKEIRYHTQAQAFAQQLNFIYRVFPRAKFIFNTRDHAAVAKSGWWANQDPAHVDKVLSKAEALYKDYLSVHPERGIHLHYDAYDGDPEALRPLFEFLGEPWDGDLVAQVMGKRLEHLKPKSN